MTTTDETKDPTGSEEIAKVTQVIGDTEIGASGGALAARAEVEMAMLSARRVPRDEDNAFQKIIRSCRRPRFAENVEYRFPRGGKQVSGPSVYLLREIAKAWGNLQYGFRVTQDDAEARTIRGYAWDLETNTRVELEDSFKKLIQRRISGETRWIAPDERDLRELTNRRGAILVRECIRGLIPQDYIDAAVEQAAETLRADIADDPDGARKKIIAGFDKLNVKPAALKSFLGIPLEQASPAQLAELRAIYESIRDGNSTWANYSGKDEPKKRAKKTGSLDPSKLKETKGEPEPEKKIEEQSQIEYVNAEQIEAIQNLQKAATSIGFDITELNEYLREHTGTAAFKKIPADKFETVCDWLTEQLNELAVEEEQPPAKKAEEPEKKLMSPVQIKRIEDTANRLEVEIAAVKRHISAKYGTSVFERVEANAETEILAWMTKR